MPCNLTAANSNQQPITPDEAIRAVEEALCWDVGTPDEEFAAGVREGAFAIRHWISDRSEFLALAAARQAGPVHFLKALQGCRFIAESEAGSIPLGLFAACLYGAESGGIHGQFAKGYAAAFAMIEPFTKSLH